MHSSGRERLNGGKAAYLTRTTPPTPGTFATRSAPVKIAAGNTISLFDGLLYALYACGVMPHSVLSLPEPPGPVHRWRELRRHLRRRHLVVVRLRMAQVLQLPARLRQRRLECHHTLGARTRDRVVTPRQRECARWMVISSLFFSPWSTETPPKKVVTPITGDASGAR